ncbi:MAG: helix-turn-helix domain-containing protein [Ignavibacterium sp.]|nr:helix-turn-helix domain-containing protein [Ignavibacterium sp.]MDW8374799.1 helix-turn-helix transcriptional regulator [Ignavibacteriales bacterium]
MENSEIILERLLNRQISFRLQKLIDDKNVTAYSVMKDLKLKKSTFYMCLQGERNWSINNLLKLSDYFNVSIDFLLRGYDKAPPDNHSKRILELEEENRLLRDRIAQIELLTQAININKKRRGKPSK